MGRRLAALLTTSCLALPAIAEPPRDSLHPGSAEVEAGPDLRGMSFLVPTRKRTPMKKKTEEADDAGS